MRNDYRLYKFYSKDKGGLIDGNTGRRRKDTNT